MKPIHAMDILIWVKNKRILVAMHYSDKNIIILMEFTESNLRAIICRPLYEIQSLAMNPWMCGYYE